MTVHISQDRCKVSVLTPEQEQAAKEYQARRDKQEQEAIQKAQASWKERRRNRKPSLLPRAESE